ncbi:putative RING-H2 finger protein ATL71 [Poecilia reticulata]|uniref:putative RING-H2 finger protein ATL71 n=1 Tax=Poecilia reticulata TaxID=8081 RepID=UPI0004A43004|nr:PREDICTED: putative RING-H2 finger protein ATL71 [Poecilia reticulata]
MDPDREEDVFSDAEDSFPLREDQEEEDGEEEEEEDEEEDARIFNTWMQQYRGGEHQKKQVQEEKEENEEDGESEGGRPESRCSFEPPVQMRVDRRPSLPCPATLSSMQLSRLHSSTCAPVTARVLLRRSSSRRLLPTPQEAAVPPLERRPSLIPTIPEAVPPERRGQFRRRNVMSLSDAYSMCLICHNDLSQGSGGTRELQCTHTFHKECIEEWLWRKQSCPTCHVQVCIPQPLYWSSTRVKVP